MSDNKTYIKSELDIRKEYQLIVSCKIHPERFEILYNRYYKQIFLFVLKRTDSEQLTADITAQVFLKAMLNLKKYKFRGVPFSAWLFRIAINEINTYYRKQKKERHIRIDDVHFSEFKENFQADENLPDTDLLFQALNTLSPAQMQLIELRFFEKRSFKEIADILDITENNAKVKIHRILKKLKKQVRKKNFNGNLPNLLMNF